MRSLSGLGFGLSIVFGCIFLAFIAEAYYLICLKKKNTVSQLFRWKLPSRHRDSHHQRRRRSHPENFITDPDTDFLREQDPELGLSKDLIFKAAFDEETVEAELMRLHNLAGPPRFLFTIKEETIEDLESEDGKFNKKGNDFESRNRPFSPLLASPPLKASPLRLECNGNRGSFNPLFESTAEMEFNKFKSSPPPKLKFLRDAEDKLLKRLMEEGSRRSTIDDVTEGSFLTFLVGKHREIQVLPLEFRQEEEKSVVN